MPAYKHWKEDEEELSPYCEPAQESRLKEEELELELQDMEGRMGTQYANTSGIGEGLLSQYHNGTLRQALGQ